MVEWRSSLASLMFRRYQSMSLCSKKACESRNPSFSQNQEWLVEVGQREVLGDERLGLTPVTVPHPTPLQ
jgi:hypothetical protein